MNESELSVIIKNIRKDILISLTQAGSGHLGGSLGLADVFGVLYFSELKHNPSNHKWEDRDRLILSIGHVAPVLYAALANAGYFDKKELLTLRKLGSRLQGHPGREQELPGIELAAGSLGQGLSVSVGMAISAKYDKKPYRIFCVLGDGELQEGSVWEAIMSAAHYKLDNLVAIVDRNYLQIDGKTSDVMELEPLAEKWSSFGWKVFKCNGNDINQLLSIFDEIRKVKGYPCVLIAETKMGKGVKSIENNHLWHGKVPTESQLPEFLKELDEAYC